MVLNIKVKDKNCTFVIKDGPKMLGTETFVFNRDLSEQLIVNLDKFLEKNRISKSDLQTVEFGGSLDKDTTDYKVLQAFIKGIRSGSGI